MDASGNLYGTTNIGGAYSDGTVFKITPSGTESVLYSFGSVANDGVHPEAGLVMDASGNLYGTTNIGGAYSDGTVLKITPSGTETVLHSFGSVTNDGAYPYAGLVMDASGNLYGTTSRGGAYSDGTVFKITPSGTESILYSFGSVTNDGAYPEAGLVMDASGNLYGTTEFGGAYSDGTVFKITSSGTESILYSFGSVAEDATNPAARLMMDASGNLYGTTAGGGLYDYGTVFKITPSGTESILYSLAGAYFSYYDGMDPQSGLVMDASGNLYGTTEFGGAYSDGTVFRINPGDYSKGFGSSKPDEGSPANSNYPSDHSKGFGFSKPDEGSPANSN